MPMTIDIYAMVMEGPPHPPSFYLKSFHISDTRMILQMPR